MLVGCSLEVIISGVPQYCCLVGCLELDGGGGRFDALNMPSDHKSLSQNCYLLLNNSLLVSRETRSLTTIKFPVSRGLALRQ